MTATNTKTSEAYTFCLTEDDQFIIRKLRELSLTGEDLRLSFPDNESLELFLNRLEVGEFCVFMHLFRTRIGADDCLTYKPVSEKELRANEAAAFVTYNKPD